MVSLNLVNALGNGTRGCETATTSKLGKMSSLVKLMVHLSMTVVADPKYGALYPSGSRNSSIDTNMITHIFPSRKRCASEQWGEENNDE